MSKTFYESPLALAVHLTPDWMRRIRMFDALEIHPCCAVGILADGRQAVETCSPREAEFWTVYGHLTTGGVEAFEDFPNEADALTFSERLLETYRHLNRCRRPA